MRILQRTVDEKSNKIGDKQRIETLEGYSFPLSIKEGMPFLHTLGYPTDSDIENYPHVFSISPKEWDLIVLDHDFTPYEVPLWSTREVDLVLFDPMPDAFGGFNQRVVTNLNTIIGPIDTSVEYVPLSTIDCQLHQLKDADIDWTALRPNFGWTFVQNIKKSFKVTTRYGPTPHSHDYLQKHFKTRNPVFNISRHNEAVATDTVFSDTHAIDNGCIWSNFLLA